MTSSRLGDAVDENGHGADQTPVLAGRALLVVAVVLTALNLRPAITSVGPLLGHMRTSLDASATWAGLLTTLPGLCFAGAGLAAPALARRFGLGRGIAGALVVLIVGLVVRPFDGAFVVLGGTLVATAGIALINVLIPVVIKDAFPAQIGVMTGVYTAALQGGGALGASASPVLEKVLGGWREALGGWALLAVLALAAWLLGGRNLGKADVGVTAAPRERSLMRSGLAWTVTLFFGSQACLAYIAMGWLPEVLIDSGLSSTQAGLLSGLTSLLGVPIALIGSPLAARSSSQAPWVLALGVAGVTGVVGLLLAPAAAPLLWSTLFGIGLGAFSLALTIIALRARDSADTARLSGMAQGIGYLLAGIGPFLFGVLHDATGGWTVPWLMVLAVYAVQIGAGMLAGRNRYV
ncbi:MFS transporter [Mycobacterium sp. E740]|uniref:MFS transporter n=1 Tax=Mycobacterium sp. E740 TaxID=1834149 RepID=UPI003512413E